MKRLITIFLILALILPTPSVAESVFADYSVEQLYVILSALRNELLSRSQWEEVTVPPGNYVVGEDIPAGHWTIRYTKGEYCLIEYFKNANETGIEPEDILYNYNSWGIGDPENDLASIYDKTEIDLQLINGYHLNVGLGSAVFVPFTGRKSPFFNQGGQ